VCCRVLPCAAVCCRVLSCAVVCCRVLPCAVVCCRVLSCVAFCCCSSRVWFVGVPRVCLCDTFRREPTRVTSLCALCRASVLETCSCGSGWSPACPSSPCCTRCSTARCLATARTRSARTVLAPVHYTLPLLHRALACPARPARMLCADCGPAGRNEPRESPL
jgi:hypothetical protein